MKSVNKTPSSKKDYTNKTSSNNIKSFFTITANNPLVRSAKNVIDEGDNINSVKRASYNTIQKENVKQQQHQKQEEDEVRKTKKEIQQAQEAKEREFRIQQDILKTRKENNDRLLFASNSNLPSNTNVTSEDKLVVIKTNNFFLARSTSGSSKPSMNKNATKNFDEQKDTSAVVAAAMINHEEQGLHSFPCIIQHTGLNSIIRDIMLYKTQIESLSKAPVLFDRSKLAQYSVDIGTSYTAFSTTITEKIDKSIYMSNNALFPNCNFEYSCSFQPRSRIKDSNRSAPARCHMYPFSQAAFNLRACWLSWIVHNYLKPYYQTNNEFYLKSLSLHLNKSHSQISSLVATNKSRTYLLDWLGKWALKRKSRQIQRTEANNFNKRKNRKFKMVGNNDKKLMYKHKKSKPVSRYDDDDDDDEAKFSDDIDNSTQEDMSDSFDSDSDETSQNSSGDRDISNVMIIQGASGSGKSTSVYECANKLGFKVIEVNASQARNGVLIKKMISEAAQSAHVFDSSLSIETYPSNIRRIGLTSETSETENSIQSECNLILFDEVDIVFEDEDSQLYSSIQQLARISKCPILLTTEKSLDFFKALDASILNFSRPDPLKDASSILNKIVSAKSKANYESPVDIHENSPLIEVICSITDGCLRSCEATIDCLQEIFIYPKSFNKIIDLTQEEIRTTDSTKVFDISSFGAYLNEHECLDFAQFDQIDRLICGTDTRSAKVVRNVCETNTIKLLTPIIHEIEPRSGLCSGGFLVNLVGSNFLQRSFDSNIDNCFCEIDVFLNNDIYCASIIKSNSLIVVNMPQVDKPGIYIFSVRLKMKLPTSHTICSRSEFCGIGKSWISLKNRNFPSLEIGNRISNLSFDDFNNVENSNIIDLSLSRKGRKKHNELILSEVKSVKRLRRTNFATSKNINEDSDDEYLCDVEEINVPSNSTIRKKIYMNYCDDSNSDSDENNQVITEAVTDAQISSEQELFELNNALFDAMKYAFKLILNCRLSEPFLQPVNDLVAPNYSSIILNPIDLGTIESYFLDGRYMKSICSPTTIGKCCDLSAFVEDIRLVWKNCLIYNLINSEYVKSSYLLNYMFETSLRSYLLENVKSEYLKFINKTETYDNNTSINANEIGNTNIFLTSVQIFFNGVEILTIPNCDLFDDQQYSELCNSLHDSNTITEVLNVDHTNKIITTTMNESFLKEIVSSSNLNKMLLEIEPKRVNSTTLIDDKLSGLEYENDEDISICVFNTPYISSHVTANSNWLDDECKNKNTLIDLCRIMDNFSDSDIIQDYVLQSCNYTCYDADEFDEIKMDKIIDNMLFHDGSSISVYETNKPTIRQSSVDTNISFAQYYKTGNQLVEYASSIRKLAIHEFSNSTLKWNHSCTTVDSSNQLNNKPIFQINRKISKDYIQYNSWLDSFYLASQLERLKYIQIAQSLLANYNCSKYQNDIARNSIVAGECIRSLCFLSSTIALDILPMIKNICNIEFINDEYHLAVDSSGTSGDIFSTRRSTRRGKLEIKDYVRFAYIKNILNLQNENIISDIF